jgi:hypothetical protein
VVGEKQLSANFLVELAAVGLRCQLQEAIAVLGMLAKCTAAQHHNITCISVSFLHDLLGFLPGALHQDGAYDILRRCRPSRKRIRAGLERLASQLELVSKESATGLLGRVDAGKGLDDFGIGVLLSFVAQILGCSRTAMIAL